MKARLHTLQVEIKTVESILDTLNGPMRGHAIEELKNLRFEMDMLKRSLQKSTSLQLPTQQLVRF